MTRRFSTEDVSTLFFFPDAPWDWNIYNYMLCCLNLWYNPGKYSSAMGHMSLGSVFLKWLLVLVIRYFPKGYCLEAFNFCKGITYEFIISDDQTSFKDDNFPY